MVGQVSSSHIPVNVAYIGTHEEAAASLPLRWSLICCVNSINIKHAFRYKITDLFVPQINTVFVISINLVRNLNDSSLPLE